MNTSITPKLLFFLAALPIAAWAQTTNTPPTYIAPPEDWGPATGERELTLGGNAIISNDLDSSIGGLSGSFGTYVNDTLEVLLRQTISYSNPPRGGTSWNGFTGIAVDQHIMPRGAIRPFVGVNFGRVYGETVHDTWSAGIEAGAKFYVQPKTFVFLLVDYGFFFEKSSGADEAFDEGQFTTNIGIGFNF